MHGGQTGTLVHGSSAAFTRAVQMAMLTQTETGRVWFGCVERVERKGNDGGCCDLVQEGHDVLAWVWQKSLGEPCEKISEFPYMRSPACECVCFLACLPRVSARDKYSCEALMSRSGGQRKMRFSSSSMILGLQLSRLLCCSHVETYFILVADKEKTHHAWIERGT